MRQYETPITEIGLSVRLGKRVVVEKQSGMLRYGNSDGFYIESGDSRIPVEEGNILNFPAEIATAYKVKFQGIELPDL